MVWNQHSQQPALRLTEHTVAVKAIAWSPHQSGLLASGGGTADRCIRFWNITNGHQLNSVDTGSQVVLFNSLCIRIPVDFRKGKKNLLAFVNAHRQLMISNKGREEKWVLLPIQTTYDPVMWKFVLE